MLRTCCQATGAVAAFLLHGRDDGSLETLLTTDHGLGLPDWSRDWQDGNRPVVVADREAPGARPALPVGLDAFRSAVVVPVGPDSTRNVAIALLAREANMFAMADAALVQKVAMALEPDFAAVGILLPDAASLPADGGPDGDGDTAPSPDGTEMVLRRAYAHLAEWQGQIVDITNQVLQLRAGSVDGAIAQALARTGELAGSDRTYVFRIQPPDRISNTHEWVAPGIPPMIEHLQDLSVDILDEWRDDLDEGRPVSIPVVDELPEESEVRAMLKMQGIRSLLAVPMMRDDVLTGFVGYDSVAKHRRFLWTEIQLLQSVANAMSVIMERRDAETRESEARARVLLERDMLQATLGAIPDLVLQLDRHGRFTGYNIGSASRPGIAPEDFMEKSLEEVLPPHLAALAREIMREVDRSGQCHGYSYAM
ncbi:MAG: GAF domain-containing protein [Rhodobacteraceae bacterium]|nr:GAF domain-containing protein [Paracoccaceae bacterium]